MTAMYRTVRTVGLAAAFLALAGCGAARSGPEMAAQEVSTDDLLATLPPERRAPVTQAESAAREAEQQASRAEEAVKLAEQRLKAARADVDARKAGVERAQAQADLVRTQLRAQLEGVPVGGQAPASAQAAQRRIEEAQHAVEVARWEQERAQAHVQLRQAELAYSEAFRDAARTQVDVRETEVDFAKARVVTRAAPDALPGVVDPRVAREQARVRQAQADYARAHAEATQRLADVQLRRRTMARFEAGPPQRLAGGTAGRSGTAQLAPEQTRIELQPLPWPTAWQGGAAGGQTPSGGAAAPRPPSGAVAPPTTTGGAATPPSTSGGGGARPQTGGASTPTQ